jgi:GNAT superfamily N-acetyltransferase
MTGSGSTTDGVGEGSPAAFREASADDLDLLALMNAELLEYELGSAPPVERLRAQLESFFAQGAKATLVTILGMPAGYALHTEREDLMFLQHFLIRSPWRGMGLGTAFLKYLEEGLASPKPIQVEALLSNGKGLAFWRSRGFGDFYMGLRKNPEATSVPSH